MSDRVQQYRDAKAVFEAARCDPDIGLGRMKLIATHLREAVAALTDAERASEGIHVP